MGRIKWQDASEHVSVPGDQFSLSVLQVSERTEAVDFQLVDELIGVERCGTAGEPHWT